MSMLTSGKTAEQVIAELRRQFCDNLTPRLQQIEAGVDAAQAGRATPMTLQTLHLHFHSLIGSAGCLGMHRLSILAQKLEEMVRKAEAALSPHALTDDAFATTFSSFLQEAQAVQGRR